MSVSTIFVVVGANLRKKDLSWYYLPDQVSVAGSILGYSVPPLLVKALVAS
jgi:hypothetical protein